MEKKIKMADTLKEQKLLLHKLEGVRLIAELLFSQVCGIYSR